MGTQIEITEMTYNRSEVNGIITYNDGAKVYWTEGYGDTIVIRPDGTREVIPADAEAVQGNEYARLAWEYDGEGREATREEEIEYEMIVGNLSREEAERNISEIDAALNAT